MSILESCRESNKNLNAFGHLVWTKHAYQCCKPWSGKREEHHFFLKMYLSPFIIERGWSFCGVWETDGDRDRLDRFLYWPITSSFDYSTLCYLQEPTEHFFPISAWIAQPEAAEGNSPQHDVLTDRKLALTLVFTVPNCPSRCEHLHLLFHNAHLLPIRSHDLLPLIYTGASLIDASVKRQYVTSSHHLYVCIREYRPGLSVFWFVFQLFCQFHN